MLDPLIRSTREETETGIDGTVQAMLPEKPRQENVNPRYPTARGL